MASVLSGMMDDTDRIAFTVSEVQAMGLIVTGPSIDESSYEFSIQDDKTITYGLGAIKGVGEALVEALVVERKANGNYQDLFDFCARIERKSLNQRAIKALIYSGALDGFGIDRASLIKTYPNAVRQAEQRQNDLSSGQSGLFTDAQVYSEYEAHYLSCPSFSFKETLQFEKGVMGYYFYNHPTDEYKDDLKHIAATLPKDLVFRNNKEVRILALISELRYRATRSGGQMALITIEDGSRLLNAVVFSKVLGSVSDKLIADTVVVISGKVNKDFRDQWQVVIDKIEGIDEVKMKYARSFEISLSDKHQPLFAKLSDVLKQNQGQCPVKLCYQVNDSKGEVLLTKDYFVIPNQQLIDTVDTLLGDRVSKINYC
ncbi:DNA polymerase III alpha subunit [hydrothermal vent metagenome]